MLKALLEIVCCIFVDSWLDHGYTSKVPLVFEYISTLSCFEHQIKYYNYLKIPNVTFILIRNSTQVYLDSHNWVTPIYLFCYGEDQIQKILLTLSAVITESLLLVRYNVIHLWSHCKYQNIYMKEILIYPYFWI
jgi:hypothetical protein